MTIQIAIVLVLAACGNAPNSSRTRATTPRPAPAPIAVQPPLRLLMCVEDDNEHGKQSLDDALAVIRARVAETDRAATIIKETDRIVIELPTDHTAPTTEEDLAETLRTYDAPKLIPCPGSAN